MGSFQERNFAKQIFSLCMTKKQWSKDWFNLLFACWNCFSLSRNRYEFCKGLGYDVLALTELHNQ